MKFRTLFLSLFVVVMVSSCGSTNDSLFYRGTITKMNGERKSKVFIFGRDACVRKSKRIARRRARMNHYDRNPHYGITAGSGARQRR